MTGDKRRKTVVYVVYNIHDSNIISLCPTIIYTSILISTTSLQGAAKSDVVKTTTIICTIRCRKSIYYFAYTKNCIIQLFYQ
jgi:hypothetical protein